MQIKIKPNQLGKAIADNLRQYQNVCNVGINKQVRRVAAKGSKTLRTQSATPVKTGDYKSSWTYKTTKSTGNITAAVIHSKSPHYRLTHLLEKGHALAGGGRARAFVHIEPVDKMVADELEKAIAKEVENAGK